MVALHECARLIEIRISAIQPRRACRGEENSRSIPNSAEARIHLVLPNSHFTPMATLPDECRFSTDADLPSFCLRCHNPMCASKMNSCNLIDGWFRRLVSVLVTLCLASLCHATEVKREF